MTDQSQVFGDGVFVPPKILERSPPRPGLTGWVLDRLWRPPPLRWIPNPHPHAGKVVITNDDGTIHIVDASGDLPHHAPSLSPLTPMTIEEVKRLRQETERLIATLLDEFSRKSGFTIESLDCDRSTTYGNCLEQRHRVTIKATI